jgi:hypothetical protein
VTQKQYFHGYVACALDLGDEACIKGSTMRMTVLLASVAFALLVSRRPRLDANKN